MGTLDELIAEAEQAERVQAERQQAEQRAKQQRRVGNFEQAFRAALSPRMTEVLQAYGLEIGLVAGVPGAVLALENSPAGAERRLWVREEEQVRGVRWRICRPDGGDAQLWRGYQDHVSNNGSATWEQLESVLISFFRRWRAYLAFEREQNAAEAEQDRLRAEQRQADEMAARQRRHALNALRVRVLAEHEECRVVLRQRQAEAAAGLWRWPTERTIRVFRWTWQTGATVDEDGDMWAEHDSGWSAQSALDDGWIDLQPTAYGRARRLRLDPQANHPVVEEVILAATNLPREFLEVVQIEIPGIGYNYDPRFDLDGERVCITVGSDEEMPLRRNPEDRVRVEIGRQVVAWIRALVEDQSHA